MTGYGYVADLRSEVEVPRGGILSRTLYEDERLALTIFAFDAGQELTEHASSRAAVIEVLEGEAELSLDGEPQTAARRRLDRHAAGHAPRPPCDLAVRHGPDAPQAAGLTPPGVGRGPGAVAGGGTRAPAPSPTGTSRTTPRSASTPCRRTSPAARTPTHM